MAKRRGRAQGRPLGALTGIAVTERASDGREYQVQRQIAASKTYTCPGCGAQIQTGVRHVVAWPSRTQGWAGVGVEARRHWHTLCWDRNL